MTVKDEDAMRGDVQVQGDGLLNEVHPMDEDKAMEDQVVANDNHVVTEPSCSLGDQVVSNMETADSQQQLSLLHSSTQPQVVTFNISLQGMFILYSISLGSFFGVWGLKDLRSHQALDGYDLLW